jgi:hypothetical protein
MTEFMLVNCWGLKGKSLAYPVEFNLFCQINFRLFVGRAAACNPVIRRYTGEKIHQL